jgi:hypothetical protein
MKFRSVESREYPTLSLTLEADAVVDLPDDTSVAGLVADNTKTAAKVADPAPVEVSDNGSAPQ